MGDLALRRPGRPIGTTRTAEQRAQTLLVVNRCQKVTPEVVDFWCRIFRNIHMPLKWRFMAADRLMERAHGKVPIAINVDAQGQSISKIIHEVKWLPPDPADTSKVIEPEPD